MYRSCSVEEWLGNRKMYPVQDFLLSTSQVQSTSQYPMNSSDDIILTHLCRTHESINVVRCKCNAGSSTLSLYKVSCPLLPDKELCLPSYLLVPFQLI